MGSKRLPNKVLLKIQNKPILSLIVDSLKHSKLIDQIIIATTKLSKDDKIVEFAENNKIDYFRGDEKNVLNRYFQCAKKFNATLIVRITGDNPLIDPNLIDETIQKLLKTKSDYCSNFEKPGYPIGFSFCEVITYDALKKLENEVRNPFEREHVTLNIRRNPNHFKISNVEPVDFQNRSEWRLTIDHKEDFELIEKILSSVKWENGIKYKNLISFLDKNKDLLKYKTNVD